MKKNSLIIILAIFIIPLALYYFVKTPEMTTNPAANAEGSMPKVLQFSSAMCYDCKRVEKEIAPLRSEYQNKVLFRKIDVSSRSASVEQLINSYEINVVPTLIFKDKNSNQVCRFDGYASRQQIRECLDKIK